MSGAEENRDVLLEEFRQARISRIDFASENEMGGILFRYFNAVRDNTARLNVRLMAKVMVGQAQRDQLFADEFTRCANTLSTLNRDEVIAVTRIHRYTKDLQNQQTTGLVDPLQVEMIDELIPRQFSSFDHLSAVCVAACGSGLIIETRDLNTFRYLSTPIMDEIAQLADFQDALQKEVAAFPRTSASSELVYDLGHENKKLHFENFKPSDKSRRATSHDVF